ncbi:unnamed protein product, partial [Owenia fusiformis]
VNPTIVNFNQCHKFGHKLCEIQLYLLYLSDLLAGSGLGLAYLPAMVIINQHFDKKKTFAFGIAVSGVGCGSFIYPPLIEFLNKEYGWRGALTILSAIGLNICACGAFMRPFKNNSTLKIERESSMTKEEKLFNFAIFKSLDFDILCYNNVAICFGISVVYSHLSEYSLLMGIGGNESFMLFSVVGITNLAGRFIFGAIGHHPLTDEVLLYICTFFISGAVTIAVPLLTQYGALLAYSATFGFFSASYGVLLPGMICEFLGASELASGLGAILPFCALGTMLGGPAAGFLYDSLHSYNWSFIVGGGVIVTSAISIIVPFWRKKHLKVAMGGTKNNPDNHHEIESNIIPTPMDNCEGDILDAETEESDNLLKVDGRFVPTVVDI